VRRDPYELLGVTRDADGGELKKAFRRLARELHPDVNDEHDAEERFKECAEAYEVLSDPERRAIFDRHGWDGLDSRGFRAASQGFGSFSDIFEAFFGGDPFGAFGGGGGGATAVHGGDVAVEAEISLDEAARGASVEVAYDVVEPCEHCRGNGAEPGTPIDTCERCGGSGQLRMVSRTAFGQLVRATACDACGGEGKVPRKPCAECGGRGRRAGRRTLSVDVPPGIADDQRIRLTARGHAGERGGPPGDLYVLVRVREDERFVRDGNDLITAVDVPAPAAALGTSVDVPTLDGDERIDIAPGTQPGTVVTLRGRGMPSIGRGRRGDQRVVLDVVIPRNLSARQRELLAELHDSLDERNLESPDGESLFAKVRRALR
jgi:molecular chaperone DnaJ